MCLIISIFIGKIEVYSYRRITNMNQQEIIEIQEGYHTLQHDIEKYELVYLNIIYKKLIELQKDFGDSISIESHSNSYVKAHFYDYYLCFSKINKYGMPKEILKSEDSHANIKEIVKEKPDNFYGCIAVFYIEKNALYKKIPLLNIYVNHEGVYKVERIISGSKSTFNDDCKPIILDAISRIYLKTYPEIDEINLTEIKFES